MSSITHRVVCLGLIALAAGSGCKKPAASSRALNVDALVDKDVKRQQTCGPSTADFRGLLKSYDELKSDDKSDRTRLAVKANEIDSKFDMLTRGSDKLDDAWRTDMKRLLLAVPDAMFYTILDRGWRIELANEAKVGEACRSVLDANEKKIDSKPLRKHLRDIANSLRSCWRVETIGDNKSVVIHVMADPAKDPDHLYPHISLLPAVSYAYGDAMIGAYEKAGGDGKDTYKAMSQMKTNLTVDFVDGDLEKQLSIRKRYAKVFGAAYRASPEFQGFVFSEAVDSYYCSQATNDHFAGRDGGDIRLKKAYAAFEGDKGWAALLEKPWFERLGR